MSGDQVKPNIRNKESKSLIVYIDLNSRILSAPTDQVNAVDSDEKGIKSVDD
ncbi:15697_t:CDS:1, partial [Gigaspora rosea]